jgi:hypothetical protein
MTLSFSFSTKRFSPADVLAINSGYFWGCVLRLAGKTGHDWDLVNSSILIVEIA